MRSTLRPWSRKYSDRAVAAYAARMRMSGGLSEVETTTTDRRRPSSPRSCSRNPRTSRPRSPTSAITAMSAAVPRAIMPSSVLLPTPDPPNNPRRCPRPHVSIVSIARTPVPMGATIGSRASGLSGGGWSGYSSGVLSGPRPSSGRPRPSTTRPEHGFADGNDGRRSARDDPVARTDARRAAQGYAQQTPFAESHDFHGERRFAGRSLQLAEVADARPGAVRFR